MPQLDVKQLRPSGVAGQVVSTDASGNVRFSPVPTAVPVTPPTITIGAEGDGTVPILALQGLNGMTGDLLQLQDYTGAVLAQFQQDGSIRSPAINLVNPTAAATGFPVNVITANAQQVFTVGVAGDVQILPGAIGNADNLSNSATALTVRPYCVDSTGSGLVTGVSCSPELQVLTGVESIALTSAQFFAVRDTGALDAGIVDSIYGLQMQYGNSNTDAAAVSTTIYGIQLQPVLLTGQATDIVDLDIAILSTGGTLGGTHYAIRQQDTAAVNTFAAASTFTGSITSTIGVGVGLTINIPTNQLSDVMQVYAGADQIFGISMNGMYYYANDFAGVAGTSCLGFDLEPSVLAATGNDVSNVTGLYAGPQITASASTNTIHSVIGVHAFVNRFNGAGDAGTVQTSSAFYASHGHESCNASAVTTTSWGMLIEPTVNTGTVTNLIDLQISAKSGSGTVGTHVAINQLDTVAYNVFAGLSKFSNGILGEPSSAPTAVSGKGILYYDSGTNKWKVSENGGAYVNLVGGSGTVTGTGAANEVAFWASTTGLSADANLWWDNTNKRLGIGNSAPTVTLDVTGSVHASSLLATGGVTSNSLAVASSKFTVDTNGNLTTINNISYSWPAAQGTTGGQYLTNDGAGNLTWTSPTAGTIGGTGVTGQAAFFSGTTTITSDSAFNWNNGTKRLGIGPGTSTPSALIFAVTSDTTGARPSDLGILTSTQQVTARVAGVYFDASNVINVGAKSNHQLNIVVNDAAVASFDTSGNFLVGSSKFSVDANGNVTKINNITYSFPAAQAAGSGYVLSNDGSGNLTWTSVGNGNVTTTSNTAGQAAFWTGATAIGGDNSFFWDNTNKRLGIGTATPANKLSVGASNQFQVSSTGDLVKINNIAYSWPSAQAAVSGYVLSNDGSGNLTWVAPAAGAISGSGTSGQVPYFTASTTVAGSTALTWTNGSSTLGVGVSGTQGTILVTTANSSGTTTNGGIHLANTAADSDLFLRLLGSGQAQIATNGASEFLTFATGSASERMRITAGGNVTIGSTTATSMFNVGSAAQFQVTSGGDIVAIRAITYSFPSAQATASGQVLTNDGSGNLSWTTPVASGVSGTGTANQVAYWTNGSTIASVAGFTFNGTATVGIGVASTTNGFLNVHVSNSVTTTTNGGITVTNDTDSEVVLRVLGSGQGQIATAASTHFLTFATDAYVERMRIASGGNVTIGSTTSTSLFNVGSSAQFQVNGTGNLVKINNVTYSWPSSQAAGSNYILSNDGSGNLTWIANTASGVTGSGTTGQVTFFTGTSSVGGDNTHFWDNTNKKLVIGTATAPSARAKYVTIGSASSDSSTAPTTFSLANSYLHLGCNEFNANSYRILSFGYTNGTVTNFPAAIAYFETNTASNTSGDLRFYTRSVQTDTAPTERVRIDGAGTFHVGSSQQFQVDNTGNLVKINNVSYSWPSAHGVNGSTLTTDASGNLTWSAGGGVANASTSAVGVVQLATQSQAWQGTPDTSAGAPLVIQPSGTLIRRVSGNANSGLYTVTNDAVTAGTRDADCLDFQVNRSASTQITGGTQCLSFGYRNTTETAANTNAYAMTIGWNNSITSNTFIGASTSTSRWLIGQSNTANVNTTQFIVVGSNFSNIGSISNIFGNASFGVGNMNGATNVNLHGYNITIGTGCSNLHMFGRDFTVANSATQNFIFADSGTYDGAGMACFGITNNCNSSYGVVFGYNNNNRGNTTFQSGNVLLGTSNTTTASSNSCVVVGVGNVNISAFGMVFGESNQMVSTVGNRNGLFGYNNQANNTAAASYCFGSNNQAITSTSTASTAFAIGDSCQVAGDHAFALGYNSVLSNYCFAIGRNTTIPSGAGGFGSMVFLVGESNSATSSTGSAYAFGVSNTLANGTICVGNSNACASTTSVTVLMGYSNQVLGSANNCGAFGKSNTLNTSCATTFLFGYNNQANATSANCYGETNTNSGQYSWAVGYGNTIPASSGGFHSGNFQFGDGNTLTGTPAVGFQIGNGNTNWSMSNLFIYGKNNAGANASGGSGFINIFGSSNAMQATPATPQTLTTVAGDSNTLNSGVTTAFVGGYSNIIAAANAYIVGNNNTNNGGQTLILGWTNTWNTTASTFNQGYNFMIGGRNSAIAGAQTAYVLGYLNTNVAGNSTVFGNNQNLQSITNAFVFGSTNTFNAATVAPKCVGDNNTFNSTSSNSMVFGFNNTANGLSDLAVGRYNTVQIDYSMAVGLFNFTGAASNSAVAVGILCNGQNNSNFFALNYTTGVVSTPQNVQIATAGVGINSVAMGSECNAAGLNSVAMGRVCSATATESGAWGVKTTVSATQAYAIGFSGQNRVANTITFGGLPCIRKDNGESLGTELYSYVGMRVVIMSKRYNFNTANVCSLTLPSGCYVMINEVGVVWEAIAVANAANITLDFGISGSNQKYLAAGSTRRLNLTSTKQRRDVFTTLAEDEGETDLRAANTSNTSQSTFGRFYWVVDVIEA